MWVCHVTLQFPANRIRKLHLCKWNNTWFKCSLFSVFSVYCVQNRNETQMYSVRNMHEKPNIYWKGMSVNHCYLFLSGTWIRWNMQTYVDMQIIYSLVWGGQNKLSYVYMFICTMYTFQVILKMLYAKQRVGTVLILNHSTPFNSFLPNPEMWAPSLQAFLVYIHYIKCTSTLLIHNIGISPE